MDIVFDDVYFCYDEKNDWLFESLDLRVPYGQKMAIVGRSGSGKSTIFKMLTKLAEPQKGGIFLQKEQKKHRLPDVSYLSVHKHIGYFYQDPLVFDGTVAENLSLHTKQTREKMEEALKLSALDSLELDTVIGEHGLLLS